MARHNIRSTVRLAGVPQNRVKEIVIEAGESCQRLHTNATQHLACRSLRCTARMVLQEKSRGEMGNRKWLQSVGSGWTWTSIDPDTRFVPNWLVAPCNFAALEAFLEELHPYEPTQLKLTISGRGQFEWPHNESGRRSTAYEALRRIVGPQSEYGVPEGSNQLLGEPWLAALSKGLVRKIRRHLATLSLLVTYHNFASINPITKTSPAMSAGISDHLWSLSEMVELVGQC